MEKEKFMKIGLGAIMFLEIIGMAGAFVLAFSSLPQVILTLKQGHTQGLFDGLLIMWCVGVSLMFIYVLPTGKMPLLLNYSLSIVFLIVLVYYRLLPRKK